MSASSSAVAAGARGAEAAAPPGLAALLVMLGGTFMVVLDFFIVNVALPSMQRELRAGSAALQAVVAGYGLANAVMLVTGGRLGDLHGRRRVFMLGIGLFAAASALCGLAPSIEVLVGARILQGAAGALLQPQVVAMLGSLFPGERRARAFAAYGIALGLGAASGQLVGGLLIEADLGGLGWRSCFLINLPLAALALALAPRVLPAVPGTGSSRLDLLGATLLGLALLALILPLVAGREAGWPAWSIASLALALPLLALFWQQQRALAARGGQPLLRPSLLARRRFAVGLLVTSLFFCGNASMYFVIALYLQRGLGLGPLASGVVFTTLALGFFATSMASPLLGRRLGENAILVGTLLLALGHALMAWTVTTGPTPPLSLLVPLLALQGLGLGMVMAPLVASVLTGMPAEHAGVASGAVATMQQVGNALGVALIGLLFYRGGGGALLPTAAATGLAHSLLYLLAVTLLVALLYRRMTRLPLSS